MAYDKSLEGRIDGLIAAWPNMEKKKMFGGVCYLTGGNMCFGIWREFLIIRTEPATAQEKLQPEHVRLFDATGRPMKGWLMVAESRWRSEGELGEWLDMGREFALTLPAK
jgi:TfoX-like protein